jgi:hypothetical protein
MRRRDQSIRTKNFKHLVCNTIRYRKDKRITRLFNSAD